MKKQLSDYRSYTLEDLINDQSFMLWVSQPSEALDAQWDTISQTYPPLVPTIREARQIVLSMRFETEMLTMQEQEDVWTAIAGRTTGIKPLRKIQPWFRYAAAAAAILVGVLFAAGLLYQGFRQITVHTPYGQLETVLLPDGSKVILNANSSLKYNRSWENNEIREVWIEGEAFLKVNHLHKTGPVQQHQRFIVHTGALNVEVLGTSFNMNDRRGHTEVALLDGKISLGLRNNAEKPIILAPGDIVAYKGGKLNRKVVNVAEYASWKDGKLYFKDVPLSEIFNEFEDIYGYRVKVNDPKILSRRLSGTMSSSNEKVFFETIAKTLNISITPDHDTHELIIKAN